ncbi:MAG TPA: histidinol dehydrogenase [Candidatus Obscuribacter sp.]|nr:histidinol dehydrogenase [Candidatus Obscuribacter sp.]
MMSLNQLQAGKALPGGLPMPVFSAAECENQGALAEQLFARKSDDFQKNSVASRVSAIISAVREGGDAALERIAAELKDRPPRRFVLDAEEAAALCGRLPLSTREVIGEAAGNISKFAESLMNSLQSVTVDYGAYQAGFEFRPVKRAACYVPGGRYPLPSTALMTSLTARAAGVKDICIVSPMLCDEVLYAGYLAGVVEFIELGGAQAVSALAFGTASIGAADVIVGPGNAYVTEAKRQLFGQVGMDTLAGPSEVVIIADSQARAEWVALDLLAQAEHDPEARVYLFTDSAELAGSVNEALAASLEDLHLPDFVPVVLSESAIVVLDSLDSCAGLSNFVAPEHLELHVQEPESLKENLTSYGALFIGNYAAVPFGDYMAGPNHTLPTNRAARYAGGLSPLTFLRGQSWLKIPDRAPGLAAGTAAFAGLEGLVAHRQAALARLSGAE